MIAFAREKLANFKVPRQVELVESLPRNLSGKVLKTELRSTVVEQVPSLRRFRDGCCATSSTNEPLVEEGALRPSRNLATERLELKWT